MKAHHEVTSRSLRRAKFEVTFADGMRVPGRVPEPDRWGRGRCP